MLTDRLYPSSRSKPSHNQRSKRVLVERLGATATLLPILAFLVFLLLITATAGPAAADCLYAIDIGPNSSHVATLYDINPQTGQASNPRSTGISGGPIGLALGQDGFLYTVTSSAASQPKSLYRIHPVSGASTFIGSLGLTGSILEGDLAFHPNGTLYGISNQREIFTINLGTGAATALPDIGSYSADYSSLAFHADSTLYALDNHASAGQAPNEWQTLNPSAGSVTSTQNLPYFMGPLGGMDFDSASGKFFAIDSKFPGTTVPGNQSLYKINTQGNRSLIGSLGSNVAFAGLASCSSSAKPDLVVTAAEWNTSCQIEFTIENIGSGDALGYFSFNASPLHVAAWGPGPHTGWSASINGLPAGQSVNQTWGSLQIYGPLLTVNVDASTSVAESNESNNSSTFTVPTNCRYQPTTCVAPPADMNGWYSFDETGGTIALDIAGLHFGQKHNGPTPVAGKVSNGLEFDGVDDYVQVSQSQDFNLDGPGSTGALTIDAWIYPYSADAGTIASKVVASTYPSHSLGYSLGVNNNTLFFSTSTDATSPFAFIVQAPGTIQVGEWNHVAVSVDHAEQATRLFINGVVEWEAPSYPNMVTYNTEPLYIGARKNPDSGMMSAFFDGVIDEVEIFDRALTDEEIYGLYAAQNLGKCKTPCPAFSALSEGETTGDLSATAVAKVFHRVRDERLAVSPNGLYFTGLFQQHRLRMAYLMLRSGDLRRSAEAVLHSYAPALEKQLEGHGSRVKLDDERVLQVADFANLLIETDLDHGGSSLAEAVTLEVERIAWDALPGLNFDELWLYLDSLDLGDGSSDR